MTFSRKSPRVNKIAFQERESTFQAMGGEKGAKKPWEDSQGKEETRNQRRSLFSKAANHFGCNLMAVMER